MILLKYIFLFVLSTDDWTQLLPKEKKHFRCFKRNYVSDIRVISHAIVVSNQYPLIENRFN